MAEQSKYRIDWSNGTGRIARVEADRRSDVEQSASEMIAERQFKHGTTVTVEAPKEERAGLLDFIEEEMARNRGIK